MNLAYLNGVKPQDYIHYMLGKMAVRVKADKSLTMMADFFFLPRGAFWVQATKKAAIFSGLRVRIIEILVNDSSLICCTR